MLGDEKLMFSFYQLQDIEKRKTIFPEHLPLSKVQAGIKSGRYLQGSFMASRENYLEANVNTTAREEAVRTAFVVTSRGENGF